MNRLFEKALALTLILFLSACVAGTGQVQPGLGSDVDQDQLTPPSGVQYNFLLSKVGEPESFTMALVSKRLSANRYRYDGSIFIPLPDSDPEIAAFVIEVMREVFNDPTIRQSGDNVVVSLRVETDRRFRATRSNILFADLRFVPHDCFAQIGTCRSSVSGPLGKAVVDTETSESGGIWRSDSRFVSGTKDAAFERRSMTYSIDQNGVLLDATFTTVANGVTETFNIRRISPR
jgi:hypothetical protein